MDSAGSATPAWRRLGLKLKNESQSGEPVPESNGPQASGSHKEDSHHAVDSPIVAQNGKPSKLGKRKHQDEPAEARQTITKKSKKDPTDAKLYGITGTEALEPVKRDNGQPKSVSNEEGSGEQRPKGDPNYRQKKKKGKRREPTTDDPQFRGFTFDLPSPDQDDSAATGGPTLVVSTETEFEPSAVIATPLKHKSLLGKHNKSATSSLSPPQTDRRKSVTFTPDTKTTDGNSAQNLFKKWVLEQKGADAEFSQADIAQFTPPPKSHPANNLVAPSPSVAIFKDTEQAKLSKKGKLLQEQTKAQSKQGSEPSAEKTKSERQTPQKSKTSVSKGKKDPSLYVAYLTQYHTDRNNWKFNKAKQNDVIDNALNIFRIPMENDRALYEYIKGLQGAGVIERLREKCNNELEELGQAEANEQTSMSEDQAARQAAKEEALQERLMKERKRRQLDGDIEHLVDHPNAEGYIRRLKRARAERLLDALKMAAPAQMKRIVDEQNTSSNQPLLIQRNSQKRKARVAISSDESSSSSEESSSSSESESEDSEDESSSNAESESDSDSGSDVSDSAGNSSSSSSSSSSSDTASDSD